MPLVTTADIDRVRLLYGDVGGDAELLSDSQVLLLLNDTGANHHKAAAACADALAARYAGRVDVRVGILSSSDSQLAEHYRQLATDLRLRAKERDEGRAAPFAGGLRHADKETAALDDTLVRPAFTRDLHGEGLEADSCLT